MTRPEFGKVIAHLRAAYPMAKLSKWTPSVYWDYLGRHDFLAVTEAVRRHVSHCPWFPTVAELLGHLPRRYDRPVVVPPAERMGTAEAGELVRAFLGRHGGKKR